MQCQKNDTKNQQQKSGRPHPAKQLREKNIYNAIFELNTINFEREHSFSVSVVY